MAVTMSHHSTVNKDNSLSYWSINERDNNTQLLIDWLIFIDIWLEPLKYLSTAFKLKSTEEGIQ